MNKKTKGSNGKTKGINKKRKGNKKTIGSFKKKVTAQCRVATVVSCVKIGVQTVEE